MNQLIEIGKSHNQ